MIVFRTGAAGTSGASVPGPVELVPLVIAPPTQTSLKVAVPERLLTAVLVSVVETVASFVVTEQPFWDALSALTCSLAWERVIVI